MSASAGSAKTSACRSAVGVRFACCLLLCCLLLVVGTELRRKRKVVVCAPTPVARSLLSFFPLATFRPFLLSCRVKVIMPIDRILVKSAGPNRDISLGLECCGREG